MKLQPAELMQLHMVAAERRRVHPPNAREEQKRSARDLRRPVVVAAKPSAAKTVGLKLAAARLERDRKLSELPQKLRGPAKKQRGPSVTRRANARQILPRRDLKNRIGFRLGGDDSRVP
jgi:hypothetical protein